MGGDEKWDGVVDAHREMVPTMFPRPPRHSMARGDTLEYTPGRWPLLRFLESCGFPCPGVRKHLRDLPRSKQA